LVDQLWSGVESLSHCFDIAFSEPFSIDPTRHVGAGVPKERSVNLNLDDLRTLGCTRGVGGGVALKKTCGFNPRCPGVNPARHEVVDLNCRPDIRESTTG
jgi:hypothetical protein